MTIRDREAKWQKEEEARVRLRAEFLGKLSAIHTLQDVLELRASPPRIDAPDRPLFSNFDFFCQSFEVPGGADVEELRIYRAILGRLGVAKALKPGAYADAAARLDSAIRKKHPFD